MKKTYRLLMLWVLVFSPVHAFFSSLRELQQYADVHPELVISDNKNWANPSYNSFYNSNKLSVVARIKRFFGFSDSSVFDPYAFKALLERVNKIAWNKSKDGSVQLVLQKDAQCVLWGDIHGAYHSLVRTLFFLHKGGIISEDLRITEPNVYFVFLGSVVNRSPYSLETLAVILTLLEKNPERVIYLQGEEERRHYWENFTMRDALRRYVPLVAGESDGHIPLKSLINACFDALPNAAKIYQVNDDEHFICCVRDGVDKNFITQGAMQAVIYGERYGDYDPALKSPGLEYLGFIDGAAAWTLMSCPVELYQKFFNFYADSFAILDMGATITKSTLTRISRDSRKKEAVFEDTVYDLIFGKKLQNKNDLTQKDFFKKPSFNFGSTMDLSSVVSSLGSNLKRGIDRVIFEQNDESNGVQSHLIKSTILDDGYNPRLARDNVNVLKRNFDVNIIVAPVGTATTLSYLNDVKNGELTVLFPVTGAPVFRDATLKNMVHLRSSYADEACALVDYMLRNYGSKKFALFYQDDAYGRSGLEAALAELKKQNITNTVSIPYLRGQVDFKDAIDELKKANPDAIGLFSASLSTQNFLHALGTEYLKNRHVFAMSFLQSDDLKKYLADQGIRQTFSYIVPHPSKSNLPIVKEYRDSMKKTGSHIEGNSLEGWIIMKLLIDALKNITEPFTPEKLVTYFESLKDYNLQGLSLTFDPKSRSFQLPVYIEDENGILTEYQNCRPIDSSSKT